MEYDHRVADFDAQSPNVARVYDVLLGGKDNYTPDRDKTGGILDVAPMLADMAAENKRFQGRIVTWLASQGITQFIDLGCGMPIEPSTHDTAQAANPAARVAYVDSDPVVVAHMNTMAKAGSGVSVTHEDVHDSGATLAGLAGSVDFTQPACVMMCALLHFFDPESARDAVASYAAALAPGSYVLASIASGDGEVAGQFVAAYSSAVTRIYTHPLAEFAGFFDGLDLLPPGVTEVDSWRPGLPEAVLTHPDLWGYVAIARTG